MADGYRITHAGERLWVVDRFIDGWFWTSRWERIGVFPTEEEALAAIKKLVEFQPHTSYYDKHGNLVIEAVAW